MAYYPYTLISIICLSYYQFIQTFAAKIPVYGTSSFLSTEIEYAIYEVNSAMNDYLYDGEDEIDTTHCASFLFRWGITDAYSKILGRAKWKFEQTNYAPMLLDAEGNQREYPHYAIKNVGTGRYLSTLCPRWGSLSYVGTQHITSAADQPRLSWLIQSPYNGQTWTNSKGESLPIVSIYQFFDNTEYLEMTTGAWSAFQCGFDPDSIESPLYKHMVQSRPPRFDCEPSRFVFIPLSLPSNCEKITSDPSEPDEFKSLTRQLDAVQSIDYENTASKENIIPTPTKKYCKEYTTSFTRREGIEKEWGFEIAYQQPQVEAAGFGVGGGFSGKFHMDWKDYSETENTDTQEEEICIEFPSSDFICPARTTCKRNIFTYKPSVSSVEVTVHAFCDGIEYTTTGSANVDGIVRIEYNDEYIPMDCPYYTTDYNKWEPGTLQFCDTCNDDKECLICRDGYILLDGVCIAESTCEIICGGEVRGGEIIEVLGGAGPWSGGSCRINDYSKYLSDSCRIQLNNATPTQIAPGPNDGPSNGEECVNMYGQCGGIGYNGLTNCCQNENDEREWRCTKIHETWSQCNPLPN